VGGIVESCVQVLRQHSTAQRSAAQRSTAHHSASHHSAAQRSTAQRTCVWGKSSRLGETHTLILRGMLANSSLPRPLLKSTAFISRSMGLVVGGCRCGCVGWVVVVVWVGCGLGWNSGENVVDDRVSASKEAPAPAHPPSSHKTPGPPSPSTPSSPPHTHTHTHAIHTHPCHPHVHTHTHTHAIRAPHVQQLMGVQPRDRAAGEVAHAVHAGLVGGWAVGGGWALGQRRAGFRARAPPSFFTNNTHSHPRTPHPHPHPHPDTRTWKLLMPLSMSPSMILSASSSCTPRI